MSGLIERLWQDLLEKDDRTSPAEYPDMALITRDEFKGAIQEATKLAGEISRLRSELAKAERERDEARNYAAELRIRHRDEADKLRTLWDADAAALSRMKGAMEKIIAREALAATTERGEAGVTEAMVERARDHLEIDWDGDEPFIRVDSIEAALEAALGLDKREGGEEDRILAEAEAIKSRRALSSRDQEGG